MPLNYILKYGVNFKLCVFYHHKNFLEHYFHLQILSNLLSLMITNIHLKMKCFLGISSAIYQVFKTLRFGKGGDVDGSRQEREEEGKEKKGCM